MSMCGKPGHPVHGSIPLDCDLEEAKAEVRPYIAPCHFAPGPPQE